MLDCDIIVVTELRSLNVECSVGELVERSTYRLQELIQYLLICHHLKQMVMGHNDEIHSW